MPKEVAVVGAGHNGLAAAVTMARSGLSVDVFERNKWIGGGASTREITVPGFAHDLGSAVHPMALASPFFREFELARRIELRVPDISFGHPIIDGQTALAYRDLNRTVDELGRDGPAYRRIMEPLVDHIHELTDFTTRPLLRIPPHPVATLRYGLRALGQGSQAWNIPFHEEFAPALLSGCATHVVGRQPSLATAGAGLTLAAHAHAGGWPLPTGGSQAISDALADDLLAHGGTIHLCTPIVDARQLAGYRTVLFDVSAPALARIGGTELGTSYRRALRRLRPGDGVSKVDYALHGPIPWRDSRLQRTPTVHLGGTRAQNAAAERDVANGRLPDQPYVLLVQPSVIDPTRAPSGMASVWAYTHVPFGCPVDRAETITNAIEAHAPGFRDRVLAQTSRPASEFGAISDNFAGGDFAVGALTMTQLVRRPIVSEAPWRTPRRGWYLASAATSPGPSVHGLSGWYAAKTALHDLYELRAPSLSLDAQ